MEVVWVGVAFGLGLGANALGLPPLLGYLVGGFALGALGVEGGELLLQLSHYGVIFLLFALGLRIRLRNMVQTEVLGSSLLQLVTSVLLLSAAFALFGVTGGLGVGGLGLRAPSFWPFCSGWRVPLSRPRGSRSAAT